MKNLQINHSIKIWRYWLYKASLGFKLKYRNSRLGITWPLLSSLIVVAIIGTVWGIILSKDSMINYYMYLFAGYSVWGILSSTIEHGCNSIGNKLPGGIPFFTVVLEKLVLSLIPFIIIFPILLASNIFLQNFEIASIIYIILCSILVIIWSQGMISFLIALTSLIPDLGHFINAMMRLAFLATPIIWEVERLGENQKYIWFNPFYIPLEAFRKALLGEGDLQLTGYLAIYSLLAWAIGWIMLKARLPELVK